MSIRLTLLCAAAPDGRELRFGDGPLDEKALQRVRAAAATVPSTGRRYTAPSQRCRQTAAALGWDDAAVQPGLHDADMGSWAGRSLDDIAGTESAALAEWMTDPHRAPHGGESVADVCRRVAAWLDSLPADVGRVVAVAEQAVVRAALVCALSAPYESFWRIDVPPLTAVRLTGRAERWNVRLALTDGGRATA